MNVLLTDINENRRTGRPSSGRLFSPLCRPSDQGWLLASGIRRPASGFTLIELLVVMVIAVVIMAVSLPAFISIGRGAGMRAAVNNVRSTVALSRQWAITHREQITFVASSTGMVYTTNNLIVLATNDHACYYAISAVNTGLIQSITDLPLNVTFDALSATNLTFKTDGGLASGADPKFIKLLDKKRTDVKKTISINGLTGGIRVE
jgi:prepilin-type N-terminal cleavage/methylation domain-containing protein